MGPQVGQELPGQQPSAPSHGGDDGSPRPSGPGRRSTTAGAGKGYIFGAFRPATGEALTAPLPEPHAANWVDFLEQVEAWLAGRASSGSTRSLDNLSAHRASDVLLFSLAHPRWEFVFQPKYAAYLNLIEPWWKVLRSLALKGRRFETWEEVEAAVEGDRLLEQAPPPVRLGPAAPAQAAAEPGVAALPKATAI